MHACTHTYWALGKWSPKRSQGTADAASLQGQVTQSRTTGRDKATQTASSTQSASHRICCWLKCPSSQGQETTKKNTHKSTHWTQSWQFCWKTCHRTLCRWVPRSKDLPRLRTAAADRWLATGQGSHPHQNHHQAAEPTTPVLSALFTGEQTARVAEKGSMGVTTDHSSWARSGQATTPKAKMGFVLTYTVILNALGHDGLQDKKQGWVLSWHIHS